jgi:radical SAM protein with 4Fe4S-binding SPASM domain
LGFGYCAAGSERAYYTLDPLGNVRPCNHSTTILGNLFEESFGDLVSSEKLKGFVNAFPAKCTGCEQLAACQGGCKAAGQVCYGSLDAIEPFLQQGLHMSLRGAFIATKQSPNN